VHAEALKLFAEDMSLLSDVNTMPDGESIDSFKSRNLNALSAIAEGLLKRLQTPPMVAYNPYF